MRLTADLEVDTPPPSLFRWVDDLARYPEWLGLVRSARREPPSADPDGPPVWDVVLVGRLGPLRRLKRLRMARVEHRPTGGDEAAGSDGPVGAQVGGQVGGQRARFVRAELDGARHAAWELVVDVSPRPGGSRLTMALHYSGTLWAPPLQRLLDHEIDAAKPRLAALARGGVPAP